MQLFKEKTMWKKKLDKIKLEINCDSCLITLNKDKEIQLILAKLFQLGLGVECNVQERQQNIVNSRPQSEANSAFMSRHVLGQFGSSAELCVAHNKFGTQYMYILCRMLQVHWITWAQRTWCSMTSHVHVRILRACSVHIIILAIHVSAGPGSGM